MSFHPVAMRRVTSGPLRSDDSDGNNGAFLMPSPEPGWILFAIASDGMGWDHVSVRAQSSTGRRSRIPTWREMCAVKETCWDAEDVVVQFHPRRSEYVNNHSDVLHLWLYQLGQLPTPDPIMVGDVDAGVLA